MDTDLTCDEFKGSAFEVGDSYGSDGCLLAESVADCERHLGRAMSDLEASQFRFGWHVGRADYEAHKEREAARQWQQGPETVPATDGDPIPF